jgi:hypothetical protein
MSKIVTNYVTTILTYSGGEPAYTSGFSFCIAAIEPRVDDEIAQGIVSYEVRVDRDT